MGFIYHDLTNEQIDLCTKMVAQYLPMMYRKTDNGEYETYCPSCLKTRKVSYKQLREIQHNRHCPDCSTYTRTTKKTQGTIYNGYVRVGVSGYRFLVDYDFDKLYLREYEQFADFSHYRHIKVLKPYCLNSSGCIYRNPWRDNGDWKYKYSWKWDNYCYKWDSEFVLINGSPSDRKRLLQKHFSYITKSNQIKLISENRLSSHQIKLVKVFDLKTYDEVVKYSNATNNYFFEHHMEDLIKQGIELNVFYLDYLARNKIDLGKYYTYLKNLNTLGFKWDKPKDFEYRSNKIQEMVQAEKDKTINENITTRYNSLPRYENGNITISPFKTASEIRDSGKALHNCIGGYVEDYSKGKTDLYHLNVGEELIVDIEINRNELAQAYIDHNNACPRDLLEHIKAFCLQNNYSLGRYA